MSITAVSAAAAVEDQVELSPRVTRYQSSIKKFAKPWAIPLKSATQLPIC